jgi:hypothetical protein
VLVRGKEGQKEKCSSNTGRAEKGTKNRGGRAILILKFQEKINAFYRTVI